MGEPSPPGGRKQRVGKDPDRGERLKDLLDQQGWEREAFAQEAGLSRSALYSYLRGEPIGGDALGKLAATLHVSREHILTGSEAPSAVETSKLEAMLRELLAGQQELNAKVLRVERLLKDQREQRQPAARRRSAGGS